MDPRGSSPAKRRAEQDAEPPDIRRALPGQLGMPAGDEPGVEEPSRSARAQCRRHRLTGGGGERGGGDEPERYPRPAIAV